MRKPGLLLASVALAVLLASGVAWAAAGDLDRTFGGDGTVTTDFLKFDQEKAQSLILQPDGKIVAAGVGSNNTGGPTAGLIARYNRDGSRDTTFGGDGRVVVRGTTTSDSVDIGDLALQEDGKIVATGGAPVLLMRFNPDGSLDQSFGGGDGRVEQTDIALGERSLEVSHLEIRADGKLIAVGLASPMPPSRLQDLIIARFNPDGTVDSTFGGGDGVTMHPYGIDWGEEVFPAYVTDLKLWQGKLVVVGYTYYPEGSGGPGGGLSWVRRYNAGGGVDRSFGTSPGYVRIPSEAPGGIFASAVEVLQDGRVLVGSTDGKGRPKADFSLFRCKVDGTADESFGTNGMVLTTMGEYSSADFLRDVSLQRDGRIVAAGSSRVTKTGRVDTALARYNRDGSLNKGFGGDGTVITDTGRSEEAAAVGIQRNNGKIVTAGSRYGVVDGKDVSNFLLARYLDN